MNATFVDMHCHLCAGLDDGPQSIDEAVEMCEIAYRHGTAWIAATAHQNETYPGVTPQGISNAIAKLCRRLHKLQMPLCLRPTAEVMLSPDTLQQWDAGQLLSYDLRGEFLLVEYPHGTHFDIRPLVRRFRERGVRLVLAHPERQPILLHEMNSLVELIQLGCLVQVSASSFCNMTHKEDQRALRTWVRSGAVHLIGSDGHSLRERTPIVNEGYMKIVEWAGQTMADRICITNGLAILQGLPLRVDPPQRPRPRRFFELFRPRP